MAHRGVQRFSLDRKELCAAQALCLGFGGAGVFFAATHLVERLGLALPVIGVFGAQQDGLFRGFQRLRVVAHFVQYQRLIVPRARHFIVDAQCAVVGFQSQRVVIDVVIGVAQTIPAGGELRVGDVRGVHRSRSPHDSVRAGIRARLLRSKPRRNLCRCSGRGRRN